MTSSHEIPKSQNPQSLHLNPMSPQKHLRNPMTFPSTLFGGFLGFLSHRATPSHPPNFIDSDSFSTNQPFFGFFFYKPTIFWGYGPHPAAPGVQGHGQGDLRHLLRGGVHRGRPEAGCLAAGGLFTWKDGIWCDMFWGGCLSIVYDCLWLFMIVYPLFIIVDHCFWLFIIFYHCLSCLVLFQLLGMCLSI